MTEFMIRLYGPRKGSRRTLSTVKELLEGVGFEVTAFSEKDQRIEFNNPCTVDTLLPADNS
jgi:hypothetical protein